MFRLAQCILASGLTAAAMAADELPSTVEHMASDTPSIRPLVKAVPFVISTEELLAIGRRGFAHPKFEEFRRVVRDDGVLGISQIAPQDTGEAATATACVMAAAECMGTGGAGKKSLREHMFEDGTRRTTLALSGATGQGETSELDIPCDRLRSTYGRSLKPAFDSVTEALGQAMDQILTLDQGEHEQQKDAFLHRVAGGHLQSLFKRGAHLDHIHSYQRGTTTAQLQGYDTSTSDVASPSSVPDNDEATIPLHIDMGYAVLFSPPQRTRTEEGSDMKTSTPSTMTVVPSAIEELVVQFRNGSRAALDTSRSVVVALLGQGINFAMGLGAASDSLGDLFHPVPHVLRVTPGTVSGEQRIWIGRMLLPPKNEIAMATESATYGDMMDTLTETWVANDEDVDPMRLSLGCPIGMRAQELRRLQDEHEPSCASGSRRRCSKSCADNQLQCWFRCMNYTDEVNPDACSAKGYGFNCTNARDEVSGGYDHGNYYPRCSNSKQPVRPNCALEHINRQPSGQCTPQGFEEFVQKHAAGMDGRHTLQVSEVDNVTAEVTFHWTVEGNKIRGLMAYHRVASWIAWGITNPSDKNHYGMNGAAVMVGINPDDNEYPTLSGTVQEYLIHDYLSAFDAWNTPCTEPSTVDSSFIKEACYSAISFTTNRLFGRPLNISSGLNNLIWSIRSSTFMHVGKDSYHEGCDGMTRLRQRGGGTRAPWIVNFSNITSTADETTTPSAEILDAGSTSGSVSVSIAFVLEACFFVATALSLAW